MKRWLAILLGIALVTTGAAAAAEAAADTAPIALFNAGINPLAEVPWPQGYTPYKAELICGENNLFTLFLTVEDTAENTLAYFTGLVGSEGNTGNQLSFLACRDVAYIDGLDTGKGADAVAIVMPSRSGSGEYDPFDGYIVQVCVFPDDAQLAAGQALAEANYNAAALGDIAGLLSDADRVTTTLAVNPTYDGVLLTRTYRLQDADAQLPALFGSDIWAESEPNDGYASTRYGNMEVEMSIASGNATLMESCRDVHTPMSACSAETQTPADETAETPQTLQALGFTMYATNCGYETDDFWMCIYKNDWGDSENVIKFYFNIFDQGCFVIVDYPEQIYNVLLGDGDDRVEYSYDAFADTFTPKESYADYAAFRAAFNALTGDDADLAIGEPIMYADNYCYEHFGYKPEWLFELPWE